MFSNRLDWFEAICSNQIACREIHPSLSHIPVHGMVYTIWRNRRHLLHAQQRRRICLFHREIIKLQNPYDW